MNTNQMTDTEVYAEAVGRAIHKASTFGKAECQSAMATISALVKAGRCDDATADRVRAEVGNHSAIRQHCEKHGLLDAADDAKSNAVKLVFAALDAAEEKAMEAFTAPAKK